MFKGHFLILCFLFTGCITHAQFDTLFMKKHILQCADSLTQAFKSRNWEKYSRYSYPAMIGALGGKKAFIEYIAENFNKVPDSAWKIYEPGNVRQVIKTDYDLQAIVELHSLVEWQGLRVTSTSYLIGESWSGGMYWSFFDSQNNREASKKIKPDLSNLLIIPEKNEKIEPIIPASSSPAKNKKSGKPETNQ
jgi:hypothetical protein